MQPLTVITRRIDGHTVVGLRGELDIANSDDLRERLRAIAGEQDRLLVLDLSGLEFMDSNGLSVIVHVYKVVTAAGGDLVLAAPRPIVRRTLEITGVHRRITVVATLEEALTASPAPGTPDGSPAEQDSPPHREAASPT